MAKDKMRILLSASVLGMLSISLLVGGTYALFSSTSSVKNHLKAGNLNVSLVRTRYSKTVIDKDGYLVTKENNETLDFTNANNKNIFGLEDDELLVPTSSFSADIKITNNSSVAFDYTVTLDTDKIKSDSYLIDQLQVKVVEGKNTYSKKLSSCENYTIFSGTMETGDVVSKFTISLEFIDSYANNLAQDEVADFDLTVAAVQKTTRV